MVIEERQRAAEAIAGIDADAGVFVKQLTSVAHLPTASEATFAPQSQGRTMEGRLMASGWGLSLQETHP